MRRWGTAFQAGAGEGGRYVLSEGFAPGSSLRSGGKAGVHQSEALQAYDES